MWTQAVGCMVEESVAHRLKTPGSLWHLSRKWLGSSHEGLQGPVVLISPKNEPLAYGWATGKPESSVWIWGWGSPEKHFGSLSWLQDRILKVWNRKFQLGLANGTFRLIYGESDGCSGLVLDVYQGAQDWHSRVIYSVKVMLPDLYQRLRNADFWQSLHEQARQKGLLPVGATTNGWQAIIRGTHEEPHPISVGDFLKDLTHVCCIWPDPWQLATEPLEVFVDFLHGQKTGLFLDQVYNVSLLAFWLKQAFQSGARRSLKILDIFCYHGVWSSFLIHVLKPWQPQCEVYLLDQSRRALDKAICNLRNVDTSVKVEPIVGDAFDVLDDLKEDDFDVVICDPPAFAKSQGQKSVALKAYGVIYQKALQKARRSGAWMVFSSCTRSVTHEDLDSVIYRSLNQQGRFGILLSRSDQAPDHTWLTHFSLGHYLKMKLFWVYSPL